VSVAKGFAAARPPGITFEDRGEQALKGVGEPMRVWAVVTESGSDNNA
jgi:class 3 adenylate cyclase